MKVLSAKSRPRAIALVLLLGAGCGSEIEFPQAGSIWSVPQRTSFADQARFAITDNLSDQLSFVSAEAAQPAYLGKFSVGAVPVANKGPHHLAASPDGRFIYYNLSNYVPGTASGPHGAHGIGTVPGSVVKIEAATGVKVGEVLVDRNPGDIVLSADGAIAYVSHYDLKRLEDTLDAGKPITAAYSAVAVIDTATMQRLALLPVCVTGHGLGLSRDERSLYVSCARSDELVVLDVSNPSAPTVKQRVPVGPLPGPVGQPSYAPYALAVSPRDGSVWISDNEATSLRVFDPALGQMDPARTVQLGGVPMFGDFDKSGGTYYVPHQGDDRVTAIDTVTLQKRDLVLPTESCLNAHALVLTPDEQSAVVVCEGDHRTRPGTAVFLSIPSYSVSGYVQTGMFPDGAAWLPPAP